MATEATVTTGVNGREGDSGVGPDRLLFLLPEEIIIPEVLDVRPWSTRAGANEAEMAAVDALAKTIADEGQVQPVRVRYAQNPDAETGQAYELVAGRRRVQAIMLINAGMEKGGIPLRVKAVVAAEEVTDPHGFKQAMVENLHRAGISPMDFAEDIRVLMDKMSWKGTKGVEKVAEYLRVSKATVTQHLRLLKLAPEVQERVHRGEVSRDAAFQLTEVPVEKQAETLEKAKEVQAADESKSTATGAEKRKTGTVKTAAVKKAVRAAQSEDEGKVKPIPRSKKEIVEWFDSLEGHAYGHPNGAVHTFVREFRRWVSGEAKTDKRLEASFDVMVERAPKGKPEPKAEGKAAEK